MTIVNFVLVLVYRTQYHIIFIWISAYVILIGIVVTVIAFMNGEWKIPCALGIAIAVLALVVGSTVVYAEWNVAQIVIGLTVGAFVIGIGLLMAFLPNTLDADNLVVMILMPLLVGISIANGLFFGFFAEQCRTIFIEVAVCAIVSGFFATVGFFTKGERGFAIYNIVYAGLNAAALLLELLFIR